MSLTNGDHNQLETTEVQFHEQILPRSIIWIISHSSAPAGHRLFRSFSSACLDIATNI